VFCGIGLLFTAVCIIAGIVGECADAETRLDMLGIVMLAGWPAIFCVPIALLLGIVALLKMLVTRNRPRGAALALISVAVSFLLILCVACGVL
jgi:hypothetical protein